MWDLWQKIGNGAVISGYFGFPWQFPFYEMFHIPHSSPHKTKKKKHTVSIATLTLAE
jgi:hypothetical protein